MTQPQGAGGALQRSSIFPTKRGDRGSSRASCALCWAVLIVSLALLSPLPSVSEPLGVERDLKVDQRLFDGGRSVNIYWMNRGWMSCTPALPPSLADLGESGR